MDFWREKRFGEVDKWLEWVPVNVLEDFTGYLVRQILSFLASANLRLASACPFIYWWPTSPFVTETNCTAYPISAKSPGKRLGQWFLIDLALPVLPSSLPLLFVHCIRVIFAIHGHTLNISLTLSQAFYPSCWILFVNLKARFRMITR